MNATVANNQISVTLSTDTGGGLEAFVDLKTGRNFIAASPQPLYKLILFEQGKDLVELTSLDAECVEVERTSSAAGEILTLTCQELPLPRPPSPECPSPRPSPVQRAAQYRANWVGMLITMLSHATSAPLCRAPSHPVTNELGRDGPPPV